MSRDTRKAALDAARANTVLADSNKGAGLAGARRADLHELDQAAWRLAVDARLCVLASLPEASPERLVRALRYCLLAPGKRLRPLLGMATAAHCGADPWLALDAGCAIEMLHTASLLLDDLPSMDDASLRRGQATTHRVFGEDVAILAAIALMNRAYGTLAALVHLAPPLRLELIRLTERAVGPDGLVGGQIRDLHERTLADSAGRIDQINGEKTGALFVLAVQAGALIAGANDQSLGHLQAFARHLGIAYQTLDDVLDQSATAARAGKDVGKDGARLTAVAISGVAGARALARQHLDLALAAAAACPSDSPVLQDFVATLFPAAMPQ